MLALLGSTFVAPLSGGGAGARADGARLGVTVCLLFLSTLAKITQVWGTLLTPFIL